MTTSMTHVGAPALYAVCSAMGTISSFNQYSFFCFFVLSDFPCKLLDKQLFLNQKIGDKGQNKIIVEEKATTVKLYFQSTCFLYI